MRVLLFLLCAVSSALPLGAADTLWGLRNPGDAGRQLVTLDPASGAIVAISASISPPLHTASGVSALDSLGQRFFFVGTPGGETDSRLYTVDTQSGLVLGSPVLLGSATAPILALEFDRERGVLYGLRNPGGGGRQLVTLDSASGAVVAISASISPPLHTSSGVSALDSLGQRFFFVGTPGGEPDFRLYTVDTQSGLVLGSPVLLGTGVAPVLALQFDTRGGVLYGLRNPGGGGRQLVTLDPGSGALAPVGAGIPATVFTASGVSALDSPGQRFFFVGAPGGETGSRLYTVDTQSGLILGSPVLLGSGEPAVLALEFQSGSTFAIPAATGVGLVVLALCLLWTGLRAFRLHI